MKQRDKEKKLVSKCLRKAFAWNAVWIYPVEPRPIQEHRYLSLNMLTLLHPLKVTLT